MATRHSFGIEHIRERLIDSPGVPARMLEKALRVNEKLLNARTTKFFPMKDGTIKSITVEDNQTQLGAVDKVYNAVGMYVREKDKRDEPPTVAVEVNEKGVVRIIVGPPVRKELPYEAIDRVNPISLESQTNESQLPLNYDAPLEGQDRDMELEPQFEVIKFNDLKFKTPISVPVPVSSSKKKEEIEVIPEYILKVLSGK